MFVLKCGIGVFIIWKVFWYMCYAFSTIMDTFEYAKMKWSMVKKLYPINPKKWTYDCVPHTWRPDPKFMCNLRYQDTPILLSFIDYQKLRFSIYKHGMTGNVRAITSILEDVQLDIEEKRREAQREIEEAQAAMQDIIKRKESI